jgi:MFS family permease
MELTAAVPPSRPARLTGVFVVFALGYLLSSQLRGVTAALAPAFVAEFGLSPAQLGLLGGAYFLSFAVLQLPMGAWLDRLGVRRVLALSLAVAAVATVLSGQAQSFAQLLLARLLAGAGVSACLIAPLTAARQWAAPATQQRINAWMLMSGALGMLLGTLPSEALASSVGWRWLFHGLALLFVTVALAVWHCSPPALAAPRRQGGLRAYLPILRHPATWTVAPLGLANYAILVAVQTLWAGPWFTTVNHASSRQAATQLFWINGLMLAVFAVMGALSPRIVHGANDAQRLLRTLTPLSVLALGAIAWQGSAATWPWFAAYCVACWVLSLTHPLVGQCFPAAEAGRAIAFFNLLLFASVFGWQWATGALMEHLVGAGATRGEALRTAFCVLALASASGYLAFAWQSFRSRSPVSAPA